MERVNIAIIGLNFGRHIVRQLTEEDGAKWFKLVAVCDLDKAKAEELAEPLGIPAYGSIEELLTMPDLPVVGLFTGPNGRADLIRQLIRAGKHVLTTKPFEIDPEAALDVLAEAKQLGKIVHLNSPSPVPSPDLAQVYAWRKQLDLGRPIGCRMEVWGNYHEQANGSWYDDPEKCPVAPIYRLGIYLINDMIRLLGEPKEVQVFQSRIRTGRPTPDNAQLSIRFADGCLGNVFASLCVDDGQYYSNTMTFNLERGTIYRNVGPLEYGEGCERTVMSLVAVGPDRTSYVDRLDVGKGSGHYQFDALYRAVQGETLEHEIAAEQIVAGLKVIRAMARAAVSGKSEPVE